MRVIGFTDIGVRYENNQDSYWSGVFKDENDTTYGVLLVADGLGGLYGGAFASQCVIRHVRRVVRGGGVTLEEIQKAILTANEEMLSQVPEGGKAMGTTCSVVVVSQGRYWGLHIGDSRIYHFRDGKGKLLTEDHTALNAKRKKGITITPEMEARYRNALSRCLGVKREPNMQVLSGTYAKGDSFLGCSDGFWHFWDGTIGNFEQQIQDCLNKGETDNITVTVLDTLR